MLGVTGLRTSIVAELRALVPDEPVVRCGADLATFDHEAVVGELPRCERYLFAHGVLHAARIEDQTAEHIATSLAVNLISVVQLCEAILNGMPGARICVIGSASAYRGSFDSTYAFAKAALHSYVESRPLSPGQQLVCIASGIIEDGGMTLRREDQDRVAAKAKQHPQGRHVTAAEVAAMIHHLLYVDRGYTTNTVIRMDGRPR